MSGVRRPTGMSERSLLVVLVLVVLALGLGKRLAPDVVPVSALTIPVMVGGWRLPRRYVLVLGVFVAAVLVVDLVASPFLRSYLAATVVLAVFLLAMRYSGLRAQWGIGARAGMSILLDLRDRVRAQGEPPSLGDGWVMARGLRSAGDAPFRGDFTLAAKDGPHVQAMVVDVSGHGVDVAPRAVQLAGAFGGLLRVAGPELALTSCNTYVVRQEWDRDYATAVHAILDQRTGEVELRCAGHPAPRVRRRDGTWEDVAVRGAALGLVASAAFPAVTVTLHPGDAVVLVSDGALDERSDDPWLPVEQAVDRWWADGASAGSSLTPMGSSSSDDQTILVLGQRLDR